VAVTVKIPEEVAIPVPVVITIWPLGEPGIRKKVTELEVLERTSWGVLPIVTEVAPLIFVPDTVTIEPTAPFVGLKEVTVSAPVEMLAVPQAVVTLAFSIVPLNGMVTLITFELTTVKEEFTPFSLTCVAPVKLVPTSDTVVPVVPVSGVTLESEGAFATVTVLLVLDEQLKALVTVTV
jgi:hypothetical protein